MSCILINDIFHELKDENNRLLDELLFANQYISKLTEFKSLIELNSDQIKDRLESDQFNQYERLTEEIYKLSLRYSPRVVEIQHEEYDNGYEDEEEEEDNSDQPLQSLQGMLDVLNPTPKPVSRRRKNLLCQWPGCGKIFASKQYLDFHASTHIGDKRFACESPGCDYRSYYPKNLELHMFRIHKIVKESSPFSQERVECTHVGCHKTFKTRTDMKCHLKRHSSERPYQCTSADCQKAYKSSRELRQHKIISHSNNKHACEWPGCDVTCSSLLFLKKHQKLMHLDELDRSYGCTECGKRFKTEQQVETHMKVHSDDKPFLCDFEGCDYRSAFRNNLYRHRQRTHYKGVKEKNVIKEETADGKIVLKCPFEGCDKMYTNPQSMQQHKRFSHSGIRFRCDWPGCEYDAPRRAQIRTHQKSVHSDDYDFKCEECGKEFKLKVQLSAHIKSKHTPELFGLKPEKTMECSWPGCQYKTSRRAHLEVHLLVHTGERNFPCDWPQCGKRFKLKQKLQEHMRIHNNDRRYACHWPGCQYRCYTSSNMRIHTKNVHKEA